MSSSTNQTAMFLNDKHQNQYRCLCIVLQAVNDTCKHRNDIRYSSGSSCSDASLTDYQKVLCKMAQILDNEKGGNCATALVVLQGPNGPDYVFASNLRKETELQRVKSFFSELLGYVGDQPAGYNPKAVQKQVFGRILEFNFPRLEVYLNGLSTALDSCMEDCEKSQELDRLNDIAQLQILKERAQFPRDMTSTTNAKPKFFRDCEDLIRAIQRSKEDKIDNLLDKYIGNAEPELAYHWYQLRHHLGRLLSLRQASAAIVQAFKEWPKLFKGFTVSYINSSRPQRFSRPQALLTPPMEIIEAAFPEYDTSYYNNDIQELCQHGLYARIQKQEQEFPLKTLVHCEANLHNHLIKTGKTRSCDLWEGVMFIATSKPPCRLCYYYFQHGDNDFQVQPSHMNLYPKWRLPDVADLNNEASIEDRCELIDDIMEHMQEDTLKILQNKFPEWKRNDSRTDSRNWPALSLRDGADSRTSVGGHDMHSLSHIADADSYVMDMGTEDFGVAVTL
ncbi:hypothetical protein FBEOM_9399 [Fusarium beomiforme]|uniref:Uncharacterized protein n=1 Tax=Fusarium beomiforme TaxID=44412 RepID=A0A9P5DTK8_9HYPO|nr:hypothetical protein FBEOM_9399 [Fusarium beomiforme]